MRIQRLAPLERRHSRRCQQLLLDCVFVILSGDAFNDAAEHQISGLAVVVLGARIEIECLADRIAGHLLGRYGGPIDVQRLGGGSELQHRIVGDFLRPSPGVLQELTHGNLPHSWIDGHTRNRSDVGNQIQGLGFERELTFLDEAKNRHSGQRLRDACHAEDTARLDGKPGFAVGEAKTAGVYKTTLVRNGDSSPGDCPFLHH